MPHRQILPPPVAAAIEPTPTPKNEVTIELEQRVINPLKQQRTKTLSEINDIVKKEPYQPHVE